MIDPDGRAPEPPSWLKAAYNRLKSDCTPTSYEKNKFDKDVVQPLKRALDKVEDFATNGVMFWVAKNDQKKDGLVKPREPKDRSKVATADASATNTLITLTGTNSEPRGKTLKERTDGVANVEEKTDEASKKVNNSANEKAKESKQSDLIYTVYDSNNPNKNVQVRKEVIESQQKKKNEN